MKYKNPVIMSDYSDPDVIRRGRYYYMIASSFNHTPGIPILKSRNLVEWKQIGYVYDEIPFERFKNVCHGDGAWAPSLRFHRGKYYAVIPFPDEGIYVSSTTNLDHGVWSKPWCLIEGKGLEDPCPIWFNGKCYLVVGFVKSRIGFNSVLGLYEVSPDLKHKISDTYTIIYDGHNTQPTIEGPKFYRHNGYFYIMAPAGSVKTGWQTALRSKDVYGPYEEKIVMLQNDSKINGPHQGALIDLADGGYAFIHFQDKDAYGRIIHLEPVKWINDWPICGEVKDDLLAGTPVEEHDFLIDVKSYYEMEDSDNFHGSKLSYIWQTPANKGENWYELSNGLKLNCYYHNKEAYDALNMTPNLFLTKIMYESFKVRTRVHLSLRNNGDEVGLVMMGAEYAYICVKNIDGVNHLQLKCGKFKEDLDKVLFDEIYDCNEIAFVLKYIGPDSYQFGFNEDYLKYNFKAVKGRWIGAKYGIYAKGLANSVGFARFDYFRVKKVNKE